MALDLLYWHWIIFGVALLLVETAAIGDKEMPVVYLLGEKYVKTLQNLSLSDNSKSLIFPADIPAAIKGIMGK